jgi:hypothetical protein
VLCEVVLELDVELNKTEHGNGNRKGLKALHPHMCECRMEAGLAVDIVDLCDHSNDGEEYPN